jgi:hypothetical protein
MVKVVFVPGNGGGGPKDNWFPYLKEKLEADGITIIAEDFPDSKSARECYWLPFLKDVLKPDNQTILVGHSSGAIAAMRFAEHNPLLGSFLIGPYYTDLGIEQEKKTGYFDRSWNWDAIKNNQKWIVQFSSKDDPWIPIKDSRFIHEKLNTEYHELDKQGHFGGDYDKLTFPELLEAIKIKLKEIN